ncbi:hypothetical protein NM208_g5925 [Fusarium decemcellulare]|uniref:Uncharacterized protein n=2 Tax=Fusarium decemcellulare TaxID=57161 RepID=A0ACC1S1K0_9HYPO|nr:hypothetical protein NM208_g9435 [Fusarium decemcellulare]KAJ3538398.1 hypothetical protein NM208_g5925 [Fusarium decemcellulare]
MANTYLGFDPELDLATSLHLTHGAFCSLGSLASRFSLALLLVQKKMERISFWPTGVGFPPNGPGIIDDISSSRRLNSSSGYYPACVNPQDLHLPSGPHQLSCVNHHSIAAHDGPCSCLGNCNVPDTGRAQRTPSGLDINLASCLHIDNPSCGGTHDTLDKGFSAGFSFGYDVARSHCWEAFLTALDTTSSLSAGDGPPQQPSEGLGQILRDMIDLDAVSDNDVESRAPEAVETDLAISDNNFDNENEAPPTPNRGGYHDEYGGMVYIDLTKESVEDEGSRTFTMGGKAGDGKNCRLGNDIRLEA